MKNAYEIIGELSSFKKNLERMNYVRDSSKLITSSNKYELKEFNNSNRERWGNTNFYLDSGKENPILLTAHYDAAILNFFTGRVCPGANDNSSGVAVLLSLIDKLKNLPVDFAFFGGEEFGHIGSLKHVELIRNGNVKKPSRVINLDSVGIGDTVVIPHCSNHYQKYFTNELTNHILTENFLKIGRKVNHKEYSTSSDHVSFIKENIPSSLIAGSGFFENWGNVHTDKDSIDSIDKYFLDDISTGLISSVEELSKIISKKKASYYKI